MIVGGVAGGGKSALGRALAGALQLPFIDGDDLHSPASIAKMRSGVALDDADRWPWLHRVGEVLSDADRFPSGVVVACSALKRAYRDLLGQFEPRVAILLLLAPRPVLEQRIAARHGHFMTVGLLQSQLDDLELPTADETRVTQLDASQDLGSVLAAAEATLQLTR